MKFPFYLSLTLLTGWSAQAQAQVQVQANNVITVGVAPHGGYVILGGSVIPLKEVTLAAQMPGRVVNIAGEEGDEFKPGYLRMLAHGGSARPIQILEEDGIDITDSAFWQGGFDVICGMIDQLEAIEL